MQRSAPRQEYHVAMAAITTGEARAYLARWELVRELETAELRRTSTDTKLRQLAALMESRHLFAANPDRDSEAQAVRERWLRLRQICE